MTEAWQIWTMTKIWAWLTKFGYVIENLIRSITIFPLETNYPFRRITLLALFNLQTYTHLLIYIYYILNMLLLLQRSTYIMPKRKESKWRICSSHSANLLTTFCDVTEIDCAFFCVIILMFFVVFCLLIYLFCCCCGSIQVKLIELDNFKETVSFCHINIRIYILLLIEIENPECARTLNLSTRFSHPRVLQ